MDINKRLRKIGWLIKALTLSILTMTSIASWGSVPLSQQSKPLSAQVAFAIKTKSDMAIREVASKLGKALEGAKSRNDAERLARLAPPLIRALLDAADADGAKRLVSAAIAARERFGKYTDPLAGDFINALGELDFEAGDLRRALSEFELSLHYRETAYGRNHLLVAESLNNIAVVQQNLGEFKLSRASFERSLHIRERMLPRNHKDIAESVNNFAVLHVATGSYASAETQLKRAMEIRRRNPGTDSLDFAMSLNNLAELYREIGDFERALPLHRRALSIRLKRLGNQHVQVGESLNNIAILDFVRGDYQSAELEYRQAIDIFAITLGTKHANVASLKNNLGLLLLNAGKLDDAQELLTAATELFRELLGDSHPRTGRSLGNLAKVHLARNELTVAERLLAEALLIVESGADPDAKWRVLDTARRLEEARGSRSAAIVFAKRAVNTLQALRIELQSLDKLLQQSFVKDKGDVYRALIELLVAEGRLSEAQQVLVMMKEDEYFDFIQRAKKSDSRGAKAALSPDENSSMARYEEVCAAVGAMANERAKLRQKVKLDDADIARMAVIDAELRNARRKFDAVLGEIHQHFARAPAERAMEIGRMNLAELKSIQGTLEELGEGTVTLHYVVMEDKVRILLTGSRIQVARESAINQRILNRRVQSFRESLQHPSRDARFGAAELYRLLIGPVIKDLEEAGARTIMLSLDGALRYIPFAALHDGERFLVEKYRITMFSEAARDKLKEKPITEWRAAGLGVTQTVEGFSPLPSVAEELNAIVRTGQSLNGVIPGKISIDKAFSRSAVLAALDEGYPVLHIASHFVLKPGTELESFLLLGDKSRLTLREIKEEEYDFRKVELIALSACETAVGGGADNFGREIEGFAALVQRQGARSVMATLWQVADESTAELMALFYANRTVGRLSKAEALRQAQLTLLRGEVGNDEATTVTQRAAVSSALKIHADTKSGRYSHPFFWAPFILTGNWL